MVKVIWGLRICILISLVSHYLIHSQIAVMGRYICNALGADMKQGYFTGLKVALKTLALKWELHIIYWIRKQVGRISQDRTLPNVFLLLYWISTFTSSRTLHNSVLGFFSSHVVGKPFFSFLLLCWVTFRTPTKDIGETMTHSTSTLPQFNPSCQLSTQLFTHFPLVGCETGLEG